MIQRTRDHAARRFGRDIKLLADLTEGVPLTIHEAKTGFNRVTGALVEGVKEFLHQRDVHLLKDALFWRCHF